jgi:hypothetical protein
MTQQYLVKASWDSEAQVWFASMVPELLEANGVGPMGNTTKRSRFTVSIETIS